MVAESFRTLWINVEFISLQKEVQTLLITSANRNEGKSLTSANYGITMAAQGKKTIIIDCDLRNPTQHEIFNLKNDYGLTEYCLSRVKLEEIIKHTDISNLDIITPGLMPPNPVYVIKSPKFNELLSILKKQYQQIVLDSCPVNVASDSSIVSTMVDGTLVVIRSNKTERKSVQRAVNSLRMAQANLLGVFLNGITSQDYDDYYYFGN